MPLTCIDLFLFFCFVFVFFYFDNIGIYFVYGQTLH